MSSDIVERLRELLSPNGTPAAVAEAADEIERLRSALEPFAREAERWAADAALIAAAPDLLHILEVIRDADRDCGKDGLPHNLPPAIRAMVDAAIAKASGDPTP
jgi:hypothetical protein